LLETAVRVEQPRVEVEHGVADGAEPEVTWLDDPGMDGANRDLEHALSLDDEVGKLLGGLARGDLRAIERLSQRVVSRRPSIVQDERARIGVPGGDDAEQVARLALVPVCGRDRACDRRYLGTVRID